MNNMNIAQQFFNGTPQVGPSLPNNSFSNIGKDIGMDLIRELVKLMKGKVKIKQEIGSDMTFEITIPSDKNFAPSDTQPLSLSPNESSYVKGNSFVQKVKDVILENIADDTFGIPELCRAIGISRSQLHNKIKANTGLSTSIYVRSIKLKKAKSILETTDLNVSEVAYEVGFKDPSYFSRLFTKKYGVPPSKTNASIDDESCNIIPLNKDRKNIILQEYRVKRKNTNSRYCH